jgi:NSS family neurotransmitter:Na+ symporter
LRKEDKFMDNIEKRETFGGNIAVTFATLGSAVGLGNIWMFPYKTGENGGASFLAVYLLCVLVLGIPVMISEFIIGRYTKSNVIGAFRKLDNKRPWFLVGVSGVAASFLILSFYSTVGGWVFSYVYKAIIGDLSFKNNSQSIKHFSGFISRVGEPILWQLIVLIIIGGIITAGVKNGIERVTKICMPLLFILLIVCDVRALTLNGSFEGVKFLFKPDFSKITSSTILLALGLSFFKLSIGMGTMVTYGSYIGKDQSLPSTAIRVAFSDMLVSVLAGLAIFPAVFAFGFKPEMGPNLLFVTIPMVFNKMIGGRILIAVFFILVALATTTASISMLEVPVAYLIEKFKWNRLKATLLTLTMVEVMGITATLSFSKLSNFKIFGKVPFDLFDFITSNILLPVGGIFIALFIGWQFGKDKTMMEASNGGRLNNKTFLNIYYFLIKWVTPVAIFVVLIYKMIV